MVVTFCHRPGISWLGPRIPRNKPFWWTFLANKDLFIGILESSDLNLVRPTASFPQFHKFTDILGQGRQEAGSRLCLIGILSQDCLAFSNYLCPCIDTEYLAEYLFLSHDNGPLFPKVVPSDVGLVSYFGFLSG